VVRSNGRKVRQSRKGGAPAKAAGQAPTFVENGMTLNKETARTGGIHRITGTRRPDGSEVITIEGELLPPMKSAPRFNEKGVPRGSEIGLPDYDISHLWAPRFGDEAWAGMMYAPRKVNQGPQAQGIEMTLQGLRERAQAEGGKVMLKATATSHPLNTWKGHQLLSDATYDFTVLDGNGKSVLSARVEISVGTPPNPSVDVHVRPGGGN
jgi:hypothetical protein